MAKFYAVRKGRKTGIFLTWDECKRNIDGFSGASYKSFKTKAEAEAFLNGETGAVLDDQSAPDHSGLCAYVDGSFNAGKKIYGSGAVLLLDGKVIEKLKRSGNSESLLSMRNVSGEIVAAVMAMRFAAENGYDELKIFHDYEGVAKWCTGEWKAEKEGTKKYKQFFDSVKTKLKVMFVKVAAHTGVEFNEMADVLAKEAAGVE